ncbi:YjzD family protein [Nicoliella spurrieriana]|uniref:YjzD family protein n=1 Tax=Nicoliella spurrieriana TaxID=2925830 RepID=A0A976X571_9LACO|nr:YjzD family protein [Nicoliella spurrieriana]UQS86550.1 YjzD family protein [Nicoliella spurrieriana]
MRTVIANITVIFWAFIFGDVLGYINSALSSVTVNYVGVGIVAAVVALIAVNGINLLSDKRI